MGFYRLHLRKLIAVTGVAWSVTHCVPEFGLVSFESPHLRLLLLVGAPASKSKGGELPGALPSAEWLQGESSRTDPQQAARLLGGTGADLLAVSLGDARLDVTIGAGKGLDFELLEEV